MNAISLGLLGAVLAVVMFTALRSPLKDDIAWLLYVARRWMAGRELYVDVIEVNPPLIIWLSAVPLSIAKWLDVNQQFVAIPSFAAIALGFSWWSACLLRPLGGMFSARVPVFAAIGTVLLVIPAGDLGQREHLLVAAFLPYLILFARTLERRTLDLGTLDLGTLASRTLEQGTLERRCEADADPSQLACNAARRWVAANTPRLSTERLRAASNSNTARLSAGILAALGCAMKPQYGLAFAMLECVALWRGIRPWRLEPMAAAATLVGYFGLVAYDCPAYLLHAVPMALALYGVSDVPLRTLMGDAAPLMAAEVLAAVLWWRNRRALPEAALMITGLVFAACANVIYFIDGKNWFYHRLPATVMVVLLLVLWTAATLRRNASPRANWRGLTAAALAVVLFCGAAAQRLQPEVQKAVEPKSTTVARIEALIRLHHVHTYIAFSEWIALGFPVVNNTGVLWASRFDSMWALRGELWRAHFDPAASKDWPIIQWVARDFILGCPDIAVVDSRGDVNYIGVLSASDPAFAHAWSRYRQIVAFDGLKVFKRGKGGCVDPWLAAQGPGSRVMIR